MTAPTNPAPKPADSSGGGPTRAQPATAAVLGSASSHDPLSADHLRALAAARVRMKKISRAVGVARFGGWTLGSFAVLTLGFGLPDDFVSIGLGAALCLVAFNELRGGAMLKQLDPAGARLLGYNQLALGTLTVAYAALQLWKSLHGSSITHAIGSTGDPDTDALISRMTTSITFAVYGTLAVAGALVPGFTAWYYFSRGPLVREMRRTTPEWILRVLAH